MQKYLALAVLLIVVLTTGTSQASNRRVRQTTQVNNGYYAAQAQPGPFARLMELERRKNAALRQAFFGR